MAHQASEKSSASVRRGIGDGMQAKEIRSNTGSPRQRWLARATPAAREGRAGRLGMTDSPQYWRSRVTPVEGRGLSFRAMHKEAKARRLA
jgi:hypothetical protein